MVGVTLTFQGGSKTLTVELKPGTYTFYRSVPGHFAVACSWVRRMPGLNAFWLAVAAFGRPARLPWLGSRT